MTPIATQVKVELTKKEHSNLTGQIEKETVPEDVEQFAAQKVANLD